MNLTNPSDKELFDQLKEVQDFALKSGYYEAAHELEKLLKQAKKALVKKFLKKNET